MDTSRTYPRPHPQTAGRLYDDEAVLILANTSELNVLNPVGSLIFDLADGTHSVADIAERIAGEYDVSYAQAEQDAVEFLQSLVASDVMVLEVREE